MQLVERMTGSPPHCMICGMGNTPDGETGEIGPFLDLQREISWGDDAYLCESCASEIGSHFGMITPDEAKELKRAMRRLKKKMHDMEADMATRKVSERKALQQARAARTAA